MTFGAMQYTRKITKSAHLKYWTMVNASSTVCKMYVSNLKQIRLLVTYACHCEGHMLRKLLIRNNGNLTLPA